MPALDARLLAAAAYVRRGALVADIGCDHGKLAVYLARTGAARRVVAADIRPAPLARARALVEKHRCGAAVECRLGDGLHVLSPDEADDIVIAGVSGVTAAEMPLHRSSGGRASGSFLCRPPSAQSCAAGCGKMAFRFWMKHLCRPRAVFIQHCAQSTRGGCGSLRCWNAQLALPQSRRRLRRVICAMWQSWCANIRWACPWRKMRPLCSWPGRWMPWRNDVNRRRRNGC